MPLVRVDLVEGQTPAFRDTIADIVYNAMLTTMNVPANDRFQIITEHPAENFIIDPSYLGITRTTSCIVIQVTLNSGRSTEMKRAFYRAIADGLHDRLRVRKEDVLISLLEVVKENWSFGNGEAQYASA